MVHVPGLSCTFVRAYNLLIIHNRKSVMPYTKSLFTFLDILGFRGIVDKLSADEVGILLQKLRDAAKPDGELAESLEMSFLTFSDSTVRSVPIASPANQEFPTGILFYELLELVHCQYRLLHDGYFLRGGVTVGEICFKDEMVFGPALNDAYKLETEFANYPRIVIDPRVFIALEEEPLLRNKTHDLATEKEHISRLVRRDSDGIYFVDYLRGILPEFDDPGDDFDFLGLHKERVLEQAAEHHKLHKVAAKYLWVATYHNDVVAGIGRDQFAEYGLDIDEYVISPTEMPLIYEME